MSELVLLVEPGNSGTHGALDRVRAVLADEASVALIPSGNHQAIVEAIGDDAPLVPSVILTTSGSTGRPRAVELPASALRASAERAHDRLGGPGVWLTAIPVTGAGGLNTVVRSLMAGCEPVVWAGVAGAAHFDGAAILPFLQETRQRAKALGIRAYTSLVPTQLSRLIGHARAGDEAAVAALRELSAFDAVLIGADAIDDQLRSTLMLYDIPFVSTYGATETCGGCVFDGVPLADVDIAFSEDALHRIVVSGPVVARRYLDEEQSTLSDGRWISNDVGEWRDGKLTVLGRIDDIIKIGGVTVALTPISVALGELDGVSDVVVLARPDTEWGQVPIAFVVGAGATDEVLRRTAAAAVGRNSIPLDIVHLQQLPLLPNGKPNRQALLEQ